MQHPALRSDDTCPLLLSGCSVAGRAQLRIELHLALNDSPTGAERAQRERPVLRLRPRLHPQYRRPRLTTIEIELRAPTCDARRASLGNLERELIRPHDLHALRLLQRRRQTTAV